jgi:nifR3 family TIM-barrel protein
MNFWQRLKKPLFVLAPMANVTDAAFRHLIAKYGKPDVFWTEFVSVDGLVSAGREQLLVDFWYGKDQHPIVAQIFGSKPENFSKVAKIIQELGFDGIDINMGCPDRAVEKQGAGAALMKNAKLAKEIILATKEGAPDLPVSIKTRLGYNKINFKEWLPEILEAKPVAVTVHLRTRKEMSAVPAHWELMPEIVKLVKANSDALVLGNGDVVTLKDAQEKVAETGCDGVMIGRGIFGNPWMFNKQTPIEKIPVAKRLDAMIEHTKLFEEKFQDIKSFDTMKKHYKAYVNGFDGAKELRVKLMEAKNAKDVEDITRAFARSVATKQSV